MIGTIASGTMPHCIIVDPTKPYGYVLNSSISGSSISEYMININGTLRAIGTVALTINGADMVSSPKGRHIYVSSGDTTILQYIVGPRGTLTLSRRLETRHSIGRIRIDASGRYLFGDAPGRPLSTKGAVVEYSIHPKGGLTERGTIPEGGAAMGGAAIATNPTHPYVYVASTTWDGHGGTTEVSEYRIGPRGKLSRIGAISVPRRKGRVLSLAIDDAGRYVYIGFGDSTVSEYAIGTGGILRKTGNQPTLGSPSSIATDRRGHIYVTNAASNMVLAYTVGPDGAFTANGLISVGAHRQTHPAIDPSGKYLYLARNGSAPAHVASTISQYVIGARGTLTSVDMLDTGTASAPVHISADGKYAYQKSGYKILEYAIGPQGRLVPNGDVSTTSFLATGLAVDPAGHYVYSVAGNGVSEYAIDTDGHLTRIGSIDMGETPLGMTIGPDGQYAYVFLWGRPNNTIVEYDVGRHGQLTKVGSIPIANFCHGFAVDRTGKYAYGVITVSTGRNKDPFRDVISEYSVGPDGVLMLIGSIASSPFSNRITVDPGAPYIYITSNYGGVISEYRIRTQGALVPIGSIFTGRRTPADISIDPTGKYAYVLNSKAGILSEYVIGPDGRLTSAGAEATGITPISIAVGP
ncbi:MAG: lactonase family protein [Acidiferrobacteraceae bacterium]